MSSRKAIAVIGSGPGGLSAAITAAEFGAEVTLIDDNPYAGGQIWRQKLGKASSPQGGKWLIKLQNSQVKFLAGVTIQNYTNNKLYGSSTSGENKVISADKVILANGSREIFLPFPGWTLPNVFGCGGLQALVKAGLNISGKKVVISGSGPLLLAVAAYLKKSGAVVTHLLEQTPNEKMTPFIKYLIFNQPGKIAQGISLTWQTLGISKKNGWWVKRALGDEKLTGVVATNGKEEIKLECDYLACGFGLEPNSELAAILGCELSNNFVKVNGQQQTTIENVFAVGELTGVGGLEKALIEGEIAALSCLGIFPSPQVLKAQQKNLFFVEKLNQTFALRPEVKKLAEDNTIVCRCEDVTFGELKNCSDQRSAKLYTRCGMGACQGRICSGINSQIFDWQRNKIVSPIVPVDLEKLIS